MTADRNGLQLAPDTSEWERQIIRFLREDLPIPEFEDWVYTEPLLETVMDPDFYFYLISVRYGDFYEITHLKQALYAWLLEHRPRRCRCLQWTQECLQCDGRVMKIPRVYSDGGLSQMSTLKDRYGTNISLIQCQTCEQTWHFGIDEEGDYYLNLLSDVSIEDISNDEWPKVFDNYDGLWPHLTGWVAVSPASMREPTWLMWDDLASGRSMRPHLADKFLRDGGLDLAMSRTMHDDRLFLLVGDAIRSLVERKANLRAATVDRYLELIRMSSLTCEQRELLRAVKAYLEDMATVRPDEGPEVWSDEDRRELSARCTSILSS